MALIGEMHYLTIGGNTYSIPVSGGSTVTIERALTSGTKSATISVDGTSYDLYAPTPNAGTVTSVRVQATSPVQSSTSTAQSSTLNTTISLANGYGDTKNPYGTKTANYVLAGPTTGSAAAPSFRALVAADIPDLSDTYLTSYTETDPVFSASAASGIKSTDITNWNSKTSNTGTVTQVTAGTGLKIGTATSGGNITTTGTINHINSVTAQTTQAVYPIKIDAQGHISGYGSAVTSMPASDVSAWAKASTKPTYTASEVGAYTTGEVDALIEGLPKPMVFKGSLGTGGTITSLPTAAASNEGYTYKVITAGTYASQSAKVGDTFISDGSSWVLIPSGDEPSGTVTSVTLTQGTGITVSNSGTAITTSGSRTISLATITKDDTTSTASPSHGGTFTAIDSITYDTYGRVTGVNTKTITLPADSNTDTKVTQAYSTANNSYPVLFSATAGISSTSSRGATTAILNNAIYANPSTGNLHVTQLNGVTVGASPKFTDTTYTNVSEFTNDAGYVTSSGVTSITLKAGSGISLDTDNTAITTTGTRTISHADTSSQASSSNSGRTYIQSITLDTYGHVTGISTATESVTNTDTKLQVAAITSGTTYYPIVGTGTTAATRQYDTTGFIYVGTNGTANGTNGNALLTLGNSTASTTANWKKGTIRLYGTTAYYTDLVSGAPSANRTITFPNATGTVALTSQIPTVPSSTESATTGITASTTATKTTLGTATSIYGVKSGTNSTTTASKASGSNGSASTWVFEDITTDDITGWSAGSGSASFSATVSNHVLSFSHSHTHTAPTLTYTEKTSSHVKSGGNGTAPTWSFTDVTVPIRADSATSVPNVSTATATVTITDPGHTHTL